MNPISAIRNLVESYAEAQRLKRFGFDYREKAEAEQIANEQADLNLRQDPVRFAQEGRIKDIAIKAGETANEEAALKRAAEAKAARDSYYKNGPMPGEDTRTDDQARIDYRASTEAEDRDMLRRKQNLDIAADQDRLNPRLGPESREFLGADPTADLSGSDVTILREKQAEKARLQQAREGATIRLHNSQGPPLDTAAVKIAADKVRRGQITITEGRQLLGGVKSGAGSALLNELSNDAVIPAPVRKDLQGIQTTRNIVDQMEELMNNIIEAKDPAERAKATLLLEQFGQTTGTLLSRGFGERGVVTDRDVARATGLVPGWKAANFAPEYAQREIGLLREVLDRNENGIMSGYFQARGTDGSKTGGAPAPASSADVEAVKQKHRITY